MAKIQTFVRYLLLYTFFSVLSTPFLIYFQPGLKRGVRTASKDCLSNDGTVRNIMMLSRLFSEQTHHNTPLSFFKSSFVRKNYPQNALFHFFKTYASKKQRKHAPGSQKLRSARRAKKTRMLIKQECTSKHLNTRFIIRRSFSKTPRNPALSRIYRPYW